MLKRFLIFTVLTALIILPRTGFTEDPGTYQDTADMLAKGTYAPDFTLNDINGNRIDTTGRMGKVPIILAFWSIYCDSCVEEMLALQKLEDKYHGQELVILAVNEDINVPAERISRFLERLEKYRDKITYPVLYDSGSKVFSDFRIMYLPTLVIIDRDGRIAGYFSGFDAEGERDLLESIENTVRSAGSEGDTQTIAMERSELITVTGEASLCGFYESDTWRKGFTGNNNLQQEIALTRDVAHRDASRRSIIQALKISGMDLYSSPPRLDCLDASGIHLARDPLDTSDPLSKLIARIDYKDFFETVSEQDKLIDTRYYSTRTVRVLPERLSGELESLGYTLEPLRINFTYVNMSPLDRKVFLDSLLKQSMFIGKVENPVITPHSTSQTFEVYTSSRDFAHEITSMDFVDLNVFIEEVTDTSLEVEVWK